MTNFEDRLKENGTEDKKVKASRNVPARARTIGKTTGNNVLGTSTDRRGTEIKKVLDEALKNEEKGSQFKLTLLERNRDIDVNASAIILSTVVENETYIFTYVIEDSDFKIAEPSRQSVLGSRSELRYKDRPATASDLPVHSKVFRSEVTEKIKKVLNVDTVIPVGAFCIAPEFDIEQEASINSLLTIATQAIDFVISSDKLSTINGIDGKLNARVIFSPTETANSNGHPVRRDWAVEIGVVANNRREEADIASNNWTPICEVSGDVRLEYIGQQNNYAMAPQFGQALEKTHDVFIDIKNINFASDADAALTLMAISISTKMMVENCNYLNCLNNRANVLNALHLDIDKSFLDMQPNKMLFDATSKGFNIMSVAKLLFNEPSINLVCAESGDNSWLTDHLAAACEEPNGVSARLLESAANVLVYGSEDGRFSNQRGHEDEIEACIDSFNVGWIEDEYFAINGFYPDPKNDVLRDISTWDYLQVLNEFGDDLDFVDAFGSTFVPGTDLHERMHARIKCLTDIEGGFVHKGTSFIIGLDPDSWIDLANRISQELGSNFTYDNGSNLDTNTRTRGGMRSSRTFNQGNFRQHSRNFSGRVNTDARGGRSSMSRIR